MASVAVSRDLATLTATGAARLTALIEAAIAARGSAIVSLTGGNTPRPLYQALADPAQPWRGRIDWSRVHLFWGDERHVPPDHHESNFGMANDAMITHVPIPPAQVHRMRGELPDAHDAARLYDREVREAFTRAGRADTTFDVMLLGLGDNAHIASLFPGSDLLQDPRFLVPGSGFPVRVPGSASPFAVPGSTFSVPGDGAASIDPAARGTRAAAEPRTANPEPRTAEPNIEHEPGTGNPERGTAQGHLVVAVWIPELDAWRITLTPRAILDSRAIVMFVAGPNKADAVYAAIAGPLDVVRWPAQLLRTAGDRVEWLIDSSAAARLPDAPPA